jgi:endo-1,4-beta-mannosidase
VIDRELGLGKEYFPGINAIRLWLSWNSFLRDPKRFARDFDKTLAVADKYGLAVMPVLFNRWHDKVLDYGGIYIDHFLPRVSWVQAPKMFDPFMEAIVGGHRGDPRILAWDLCNEPYSYSCPREQIPQIVEAETAWLQGLYDKCKELGAQAPITVGIHPGVPPEMVNKISDVLSIHPYWVHNSPNANREAYEKKLDDEVAYARQVGKPILATECCWGSLDDKVRVESIRYTLTQLKKRGIGWLVYLLHHSLIADAHRPEFGPVGFPGYLGFIEANGSLRPGHDVFNEF